MYRSFSQFLENRSDYWGSQGAGILAFATDERKWLVALRSVRVREPNTWCVIGGKIDDKDVDPQEAAKREFLEEAGYSGPMRMHKAHVWKSPEMKEDGKPKFIYHNFIGEIVKGAWEPRKNWETEKFNWVSYDKLLKLQPKHYGLEALLSHAGSLIKAVSLRHEK